MTEARSVLVRGTVYTGDWHGGASTDAVWAVDGVVRALGAEALRLASGARVVEVGEGRCAVPGFWDSHIHLTEYGFSLDEVPLGDVHDGEGAASHLEEAVRVGAVPPEGPILGRGWMVGDWRGALPHRDHLRRLGDRPVLLWNHDYHSVWVNDAALEMAGIDRDTPDPAGGRIERDARGEPTGILRDEAASLVQDLVPPPSGERLEHAILRAQESLLAMGVVAVCSMNEDADAVRALIRLARDGRLKLRVGLYLPARQVGALAELGLATGLGDDRLWLSGVKAFMDGALGSQTAWMRAPYDEVGGTGLAMPFASALDDNLAALRAAGLRLALHAIGDRAVSEAVRALGAGVPSTGWDRVEHAQLVTPDTRAAWPGERVAASVQPIHLTDDIELTARFWGPERARSAFPFASLLRRGVPLLFGSDAPVSDPDPIKGLWAAVERRRPEGEVHQRDERIGVTAALEAYAATPARIEGRPHLGRLTPGSPLSLALLSADPVADAAALGDLRVVGVEVA